MVTENFLTDAFNNSDNGGGDLRFSSDEAGATQLACEVVIWETGTDNALVFVKVPTVTTATDTVIYVWYNKTGETQPVRTDTYGSDNVWDSNFVRVLHFNGNGADSTANNLGVNTNNGVVYSTSGGMLKGYADFDEGDSLVINDAASIDLTTGVTIEVGVNPDTVATHHRIICAKDDQFLSTGRNTYGLMFLNTSGDVYGGVGDGTNNADSQAGAVSVGSFNYMGFAWDTTNRYSWKSSTFSSTGTDAITSIQTNTDNLYIGKNNDATDPYGLDGKLSEFRLSNTKRSQDWAVTTFNNVTAPATFSTPSAIVSVTTTVKDLLGDGFIPAPR